jgi:hypothetical protein
MAIGVIVAQESPGATAYRSFIIRSGKKTTGLNDRYFGLMAASPLAVRLLSVLAETPSVLHETSQYPTSLMRSLSLSPESDGSVRH